MCLEGWCKVNNRGLKVLHINSFLIDRFFYNNIYKNQIKLGNEIEVYVGIHKGGSRESEKLGSHIVVSEDYAHWNRYLFFLKQKKIISALEKKIQVSKFDILHAHSLFTNGYVTMKLAEKYNKPYIVAVRNCDVNNFFKKILILRPIGRNILNKASAVIFLSSTYRDFVIDRYVSKYKKKYIQEKSIVIPNGIDEFWLKNSGYSKKLTDPRIIRILYVGEITNNKNIEQSIKALELLEQDGFQVSFTVIGRIKNRAVFKRITQCKFLRYKNQMPKEELIKEYRNADIFLMPSKTEAFGLVYAEAMSQGLPVIYTRGQGFDGQFEIGKVGYAVAYNSTIEIKDAITKIIQNYEIMSQNCINGCKKFDWYNFTLKYQDVYLHSISK